MYNKQMMVCINHHSSNDIRWSHLIFVIDSAIYEINIKDPIFKFKICDINCDSIPDIAIGIWKAAPLDNQIRKRIHFYTLSTHKIVPLWRGTRLSGELINFHIINNRVVATELMSDNSISVNMYKWQDFGFILQ
jgi:hypothetical protein